MAFYSLYNGKDGKCNYKGTEYDIYTGATLDPRIINIIAFAEGDMTLQELYTELLLADLKLLQWKYTTNITSCNDKFSCLEK